MMICSGRMWEVHCRVYMRATRRHGRRMCETHCRSSLVDQLLTPRGIVAHELGDQPLAAQPERVVGPEGLIDAHGINLNFTLSTPGVSMAVTSL